METITHMFKTSALIALAMLACASPAVAGDLSTSILRPTPLDPMTGLISGKLPGGSGQASYYVSADLSAGDLMTQLRITGRAGGERRLTFQLLGADAKVRDSAFVRAGFGTLDEGTSNFAIDNSGRHVIRLVVEGEENGSFCVLMGGTALPNAKDASCPGQAVETPPPAEVKVSAAPPPPPPPPPLPPFKAEFKVVEVIKSQCEERLRVGSDFLFDFDRADVRPEADEALAEVVQRVEAAQKRVVVEGHTDGKGTDGYHQALSERRAAAVRTALIARGAPESQLLIHGYGKSRPIAPNAQLDGSDDPEGRQKNRRVEVVINTCG
jgi:outer membrane protein OmpA-like peptidoglycan-associated protein